MSKFKDAFIEKLDLSWFEQAQLGVGYHDLTDIRTPEQIKDATESSLPVLQKEILSVPKGERFEVLKNETDFVPGSDKIFDATDKFGKEFQESFATAIAKNSDFAGYVVEKLNDGGGAIIDGLKGVDPKEHQKYLTQIMDKVAEGGKADVGKFDKVLEDATKLGKAEKSRAEKLKKDSKADVSAEDEKIEDLTKTLVKSAKAAGADIPAMANMDSAIMLGFLGDLFDPNMSVKGAINNMGEALDMSPEELEALQRTLGPIMNIIKPMLQPYAELFQKYKDPAKEWGRKKMEDLNTLSGESKGTLIVDRDSEVRNMDKDDFIQKYDKATGGQTVDARTALKALAKADPKASEEVNAIIKEMDKDPDFAEKMDKIAEGGAEKMQQLHEHMIIKQSPRDAVNDTANGITPDMKIAERQASFERLNTAATVAPIDDAKFMETVKGNLKGSSPKTMQDQFNILKESFSPDAHDELDKWQTAAENGHANGRIALKNMFNGTNEQIAKNINKFSNDLEAGKTIAASLTP